MKKFLAILLVSLLLVSAFPASAGTRSTVARTTQLDLTGVTSAQSNSQEGWAYDPTGRDGQPLLTLDSYGSESAHSAPVLVPANTTIVVNGDCYLDNACMGDYCDVISGCYDGFLRIEGTGTLNIYALSYHGRGISVPTGGVTDMLEFLYINDITVNIYSQVPTSSTAFYIKEGIYANQGMEFHNAEINIINGTKAIWLQGASNIPTINLTEDTCPELLIDNTDININMDPNGFSNYSNAIQVVCGRIRVINNSDIVIRAASKSIYASFSLTMESGSLDVFSSAMGGNSNAIIYVKNLVVGSGVQSLYARPPKFTSIIPLYCTASGISSLGEGLEMAVGTFEDGNFTSGSDPDNNNLPAIKIVRASTGSTHTVNFYGFDDELIESVQVEDGAAATAPEVPASVQGQNGPHRFFGWDIDFSNVTEDLDVHALYVLVGDVNLSGDVTATDALLALRYSMDAVELEEIQVFAADFNESGEVTGTDALLILRSAMD